MDPYNKLDEVIGGKIPRKGGAPTLLSPGKVVIQPWMSSADKQFIETQPSIRYVIKFLEQFIPMKRGTFPPKPAKTPGERYLAFKSGTSSGKSTTLPPFLFNTFFEGLKKNIAMTEPRVFNCIDIVDSIAKWNKNLVIGETIGYSTGNFKKKPNKGIVVETIGTLLQHLKTMTDEQFMAKHFVIIIDEVHARSVDNDLVMYYLKKLIERQYQSPECPFVILTSGTFDEKLFMTYYDIPKEHYIEVVGSTFPIVEHWPDKPITNVTEELIKTIKKIHTCEEGIKDIKEGKTGFDMDILIIAEYTAILDKIAYEIHKLNLDPEIAKVGYIYPIPITSERFNSGGKYYQALMSVAASIKGKLMSEESAKLKVGGQIIVQGPNGIEIAEGGTMPMLSPTEMLEQIKWRPENVVFSRRVIIATNLIETGVTPEIKYCIDTGLMLSTEFNPVYNATVLAMSAPVTRGMAIQRRGRVGRMTPGVWYPMYTKELFGKLVVDQFPDIITQDVSSNILSAIIQETGSELDKYDKFIKVNNKTGFSISTLDIMGYPATDSLEYCIEKLFVLGFITANNEIPNKNALLPTRLGIVANKFRKLKLESIKMILAGYYHGANILDLVTIAIFLERKWDTFSKRKFKSYRPRNILGLSDNEANLYSKMFWVDDFIEMLWIWYDFMEALNTIDPQSKRNLGIGYAKRWCDNNELIYDGLLSIIQSRDELIDSMINIGVNPYYNGLNLKRGSYNLKNIMKQDIELGMKEIAKIKSCIYDGYKLNTATFDSATNSYITDWKKIPLSSIDSKLIKVIPVPADQADVRQDRPRTIVCSMLNVTPDKVNRNLFSLNCGGPISILDGFVDVDEGLLSGW